jgi:hypothetical protein
VLLTEAEEKLSRLRGIWGVERMDDKTSFMVCGGFSGFGLTRDAQYSLEGSKRGRVSLRKV